MPSDHLKVLIGQTHVQVSEGTALVAAQIAQQRKQLPVTGQSLTLVVGRTPKAQLDLADPSDAGDRAAENALLRAGLLQALMDQFSSMQANQKSLLGFTSDLHSRHYSKNNRERNSLLTEGD